MNPLAEKTIFLSGATSGIGRALALRLADKGASLALCGRSKEKLAEIVQLCRDAGAPAIFAQAFDATDNDAVRQFVHEAAATLGSPVILINNAGANPGKSLVAEQNITELEYMWALNCRSPWVFTQACHPLMAASGGGHVVNILSTTLRFANETVAGYTASKAACEAWTNIYRKEARNKNIRVTGVYPGGTDTPFRAVDRPDYMRPETVAEAIYQALILPPDATVHEIILRPLVEENF